MIKWIIFDQAGVQTHNVFSRKDFYSINNKQFSAKELEAVYRHPDYKKFSIGTIDERDFIFLFLKENNIELTVDEFIEIFRKGIEPIKGMKEILEELYKSVNLACLINEGSEWANYKMNISGFREYFKEIFISGDLHVEKPNPEIYKIALSKLNASSEECIFIDDQKENCQAAEKLGIKSIVFENPIQLKKELATFSININ